MSTVTATTPSTAGLTIAPTHNTAPVFEFRCLYTHDLRKKKKIWHDGALRFHTFNRRVMVYDDSKNYIGDAHWAGSGGFQEGEELKLDKGVLVQVAEQIGRTETDLAPIILEKRRPETTFSTLRTSTPTSKHSPADRQARAISQPRLKSLAAVLGASQGPIGRARLPTGSPFEQRQDFATRGPSLCAETSVKRSRTATEKENVAYKPTPIKYAQFQRPPSSEAMHPRGDLYHPPKRGPICPNKPLESSADLYIPKPPALWQPRGVTKDMSQEAATLEESKPPPDQMTLHSTKKFVQRSVRKRLSTDTASGHMCRQQPFEDRSAIQSGEQIGAKTLSDSSAASTCSYDSTVISKLLFANKRPRKKLIYKDLLPHGEKKLS